jgi:hypothetical protein
VIAVTAGRTMFVASRRPPSPTSTTHASAPDRREHLEEREGVAATGELAERRLHALERPPEVRGGGRPAGEAVGLAMDDDTLAEPDEVGRRVEAHPAPPGSLEDRGDEGRGRALALRSGDVDHRPHAALRAAEGVHEALDAVEVEGRPPVGELRLLLVIGRLGEMPAQAPVRFSARRRHGRGS